MSANTPDVAPDDAGRLREAAALLRAEVEAVTDDYRRIWPTPYSLPPNLTLATRALALAHAALGDSA